MASRFREYSDEFPGLEAPARDQARLHIGVIAHEPLYLGAFHTLEDDRPAARWIADCAGHQHPPGPLLGRDPPEVSLAVGPATLEHVLDVFIEQEVVLVGSGHDPRAYALARATLSGMANIEKSGGYTPRRVRERRAYRLVAVGGTAGAIGVVTLVLAVVGVVSAGIPIIALIVAAICAVLFRQMVASR